MTLKALFLAALALIGTGAVALHLFAPDLMHHVGQMLHGAR